METLNTLKVSRGNKLLYLRGFSRMEQQEKEIIIGALALFNRYGIRSVTMDDVAGELGISKKTIYKYFENKADVVHHCMLTIYNRVQEKLVEVHRNYENPIDELMAISRVMINILESNNPSLRFQLEKYYPQTFSALYQGRQSLVTNVIRENIERGKKTGYYREDAETDIITHLYCSKMKSLPEEEEGLIKSHGVKSMMEQGMIYHIRGLATAKGLNYLEEKMNENPENEI